MRTSLASLFALAACTGVAADPQPNPRLVQAYYAREVAAYCGLDTPPVEAGFRSEVRQIMRREGIDEAGKRLARRAAWAAAELEWSNRGLGGFRGWCRTEGRSAAEHFLAVDR